MSNCQPTERAATPNEVMAMIRGRAFPLGTERVDLKSARGRVLRAAVTAPEDQPPFDRSAMDGYAVRMDDSADCFRIVDRIRAGDWRPRILNLGEAVQIATGGALPCEGLQVVIREDTSVAGDRVTRKRRDESRFIRFRGEDARVGQRLIEVGARLTPGALALCASLGETSPEVSRLPRVLHWVTGDEIVPPMETPVRGQIRDSNSTLVHTFLAQWAIEPVHRRIGESRDGVRAQLGDLSSEIEEADIVLISGGASVGEHDFTAALLEELGTVLHVRRTASRPGKPMIFGTRGRTLAFGLPGNPLAHFVCLHLYVRRALEGLSAAEEGSVFLSGRLAVPFEGGANSRETFWPARLRVDADGAELSPLAWRSSGDLTSLASANALIRVPVATGLLEAGAKVDFVATSPDL